VDGKLAVVEGVRVGLGEAHEVLIDLQAGHKREGGRREGG